MPRFSDLLGGGDAADENEPGDDATRFDETTRHLPPNDSTDHLDRLAGMAAARADGEPERITSDEVVTAEAVDDAPDSTVPADRAGLAGLAPVDDDFLPSKKERS